MITIDGSQGEGGGQMLRTSLGLSMLTGQPFRMERVRANRDKPGLMRQHLACVLAAAEICSADVDGAHVGSSAVTFKPKAVKPGDYRFATGSAGSTTLVFQAVLPALLTAGGPSTLTLEGGTHNVFAPPLDFVERAFLGVVNRMGPRVEVWADRMGFYPAGGGRWTATVTPAAMLSPVEVADRGPDAGRTCHAVVAGLPGEIAVRELAVVKQAFDWPDESFQIRQAPDDQGPGNVVMIELAYGNVTEVCTAFGQRGVRAEAVADAAVQEAKKYLAGGAPVGEHLADQLLIPLAMAGGGSYVTTDLTEHTRTNVEVVKRFLDVEVEVSEEGRGRWRVAVTGR
ncbi:MAG TPA: RNA 3'-terminal phosphate cyclase [Humisphaera sp.]